MAHHLDEDVGLEPSCLQPLSIESPRREILLIVGMESTGQGQTNLVYETGQIQPARHHFPGTPGMDHIIHNKDLLFGEQFFHLGGQIRAGL